jgi:hypothetical protein
MNAESAKQVLKQVLKNWAKKKERTIPSAGKGAKVESVNYSPMRRR